MALSDVLYTGEAASAVDDVGLVDYEADEADCVFIDDDDDDAGAESGVPGSELLMHPSHFKPLYVTSKWKDTKTKDNRVSVAVFLPAGTGKQAGDVNVHVGNGNFLKVGIVWLPSLTNVPMLMEMWPEGDGVPKIEEYHPQVQGFYDF